MSPDDGPDQVALGGVGRPDDGALSRVGAVNGGPDTEGAETLGGLGRMEACLGAFNGGTDQFADRVFGERRHGGRAVAAGGVRWCVFVWFVFGGVGQARSECDAHARCVFGNCDYRARVIAGLHNTGAFDCRDPDVRVVGTHDVVSTAEKNVRVLVKRIRDQCAKEGTPLAPRAAHCSVAVVKTKEDTFLITVATAVVIIRYFHLLGEI